MGKLQFLTELRAMLLKAEQLGVTAELGDCYTSPEVVQEFVDAVSCALAHEQERNQN